jgi:membrane dipeptidase
MLRRTIYACTGLAVFSALALVLLAGGSARPGEISKRAREIHFSAIVVDTHDDTPQRFLFENFDLGHRDARGNIDIPRMREGGLNAIFFSIWCPATLTGPPAVKRALDLIDSVREQVRKHPQDLALATTADEVRHAHDQGKIAVLMGVEGGHMIDNDLGVLRQFAALGVRYMTLTHTLDTDWADSSTDVPKHNGLTDFGRDVVREMNRLGVLVDISHVADKTFYDALEVSKAPMIASHSSCRAICNAPRNMTDDMIRALAAKGGVIQINYHAGFLSQAYYNAETHSDEYAKRTGELEKAAGDDEAAKVIADNTVSQDMMVAGTLPKVDWEAIVDHIDHAVKLVGAEHVGLGSDFDGANMPLGMEDCSQLPKLTDAMLRRGYKEDDIRKILGGNTLRVLAEAERVSRQLQAADAEQPRWRPAMDARTSESTDKTAELRLELLVNADDRPADVKLVKGSDPQSNQTAVAERWSYTFEPAKDRQDNAVAVRVPVFVGRCPWKEETNYGN